MGRKAGRRQVGRRVRWLGGPNPTTSIFLSTSVM